MKKVLIIAEAGVNHNGDINLAKKLIDAAADAGVDIVKFQTFKAEKLVSKFAKKADYQIQNLNDGNDSQFQMLKKLELDFDSHKILIDYCNLKNIKFLSTGFDEDSVDELENLGIDIFKIPSGEITNLPYLNHIGKKNKSIILSTGMANLQEIKNAMAILISSGTSQNKISVLHCTTQYPTPMLDVNLLAMQTIQKELNVSIGYSDHTLGIEVPIAAVAMGANIIEKHFTLDKSMEGPDHKASLDPIELKNMVNSIRNIELALGSSIKEPTETEMQNSLVGRKSIHLSKPLSKNHTITKEDLIMKRPGDGISPMEIENVLGKKLNFDFETEHKLSYKDIF